MGNRIEIGRKNTLYGGCLRYSNRYRWLLSDGSERKLRVSMRRFYLGVF